MIWAIFYEAKLDAQGVKSLPVSNKQVIEDEDGHVRRMKKTSNLSLAEKRMKAESTSGDTRHEV